MRIQKYISQCGVCSRREAERKILEGDVEVNGVPAEIGQDVNPEADKVSVDGALVRGIVEDKVVLAMNKPKGYICSNGDPFKAQTVFDLLPEPFASMKLFCCGRLDKNSQGLLLLTNDGDLANKIVLCDGEKLKASKIIPDSSNLSDSPRRVEVWLNQGRKREIRRMFEAMGYFVKELKRYQIGGLVLKRIPEGAVKILGKADIEKIFSNRHQ